VGPEPLPQRVGGAQALELADDVGVATGLEVGADALLERVEPGLLEADGLRPGEVDLGEVAQRRTPPQVECGPQAVGGGRRMSGGQLVPGPPHQGVEAGGVDLVVDRQAELVAGRGGEDAGLLVDLRQPSPQAGDQDPQGPPPVGGASSPHTSPIRRSGSIGRPGSRRRRSRIARSRRAVMPRARSSWSTSSGPRSRNCIALPPPVDDRHRRTGGGGYATAVRVKRRIARVKRAPANTATTSRLRQARADGSPAPQMPWRPAALPSRSP